MNSINTNMNFKIEVGRSLHVEVLRYKQIISKQNPRYTTI